MVFAYRLKDLNSKETGRVIEGFTIRHTWQFTSAKKTASLRKWNAVAVLEAEDIVSLKKAVDAFDKEQKAGEAGQRQDPGDTSQDESTAEILADLDDPLVGELQDKSLSELKEFAKVHGFDEIEYSRLTKTKLVEYIILGMRGKENA